MTKILENKWVMAALILVAIAAVGWNFRSSLGGSLTVNARESADGAVDPAAGDAMTLHNALLASTNKARLNGNLTTWRQATAESEIKRDPFLYPVRSEHSDGSVANPEVQGPPSLDLQAISMQGTAGLAVINRQLVGLGDSVSGYEVLAITAGEVQVQGYGEKKTLRMDFALPVKAPSSDESPTPTQKPKP